MDDFFDIPTELKKIPHQPGVYLMHDETDAIIYVGKAVDLYRRVHQYFQSRYKGPKIEQMVTRIRRFEYIVTDSELEALVLECNLIKEHRPKYNTMLKDDKTYPYIKVTLGEEYPRVLFSRQMKKDASKYFGPYTSSWSVKKTIELLCKLYGIRTCRRVLPRDIGKERPCLNYHIHQCPAPCQGYVTKENYQERVQKAVRFLSGDYKPILSELEEKMHQAAEALEFEKAAEYKELLSNVRAVAQKQKITDSDGEDRDIIALAKDDRDAVVQVFFVREGKLLGREHFHVMIGNEDTAGDILSVFLRQYYAGTPFLPKEILLQTEVEDHETIEAWLSERRGKAMHLRVPKKGSREKMVELAASNAEMVLSRDKERIRREEGRTIGAVKEIALLLGMDQIGRMEAYDISNTSGYESVGSMVVYEKGKPRRNEYRKFRLRTVTGPDDYASMHEVLTRRFSHGLREREEMKAAREAAGSEAAAGTEGAETGLLHEELGRFSRFPDLILMDGGKGQVNIAEKVLSDLHLSIPVCGMVKDDSHRTRGLYYNNKEIPIEKTSEGFKLITRIQDEAHRFAIEYHRSLRGKDQVHSILDDIPGIGPERRKALMKHFASIDEIRQADVETLMAPDRMNRRAAESVYRFFHEPENGEQ